VLLERESEDILDLTKEWAVRREEEKIRREEKREREGKQEKGKKERKRKGKKKENEKKEWKGKKENELSFLKKLWLINYIVDIILGNENKIW
jgi:hypothetical protein